ncbi:hypothetical protein PF008_g26456 [Phytophthora fragariae]|uniref:Uncharacterized protein n=1 Tax=Phytophthora fragariae TaxID=53985 RepID=A0A6G0QH01_9STRA|nr:hypothetical protein PF008_g26456 [Phytophthora fragariae]
MKLLLTKAAAFGLFFTADRLAPTCGSTVTVTELNEDHGCEGRTTAMYATITPGSCADNGKYDVCTTENGWGLLSSEYTLCEFDQAAYLQYAFSTSFYVLVEFYWDSPCDNLWKTVVLLADGKCHNTVQETVLVTVDEDTLHLQNRGMNCESGVWGNITDPVPMAMVNSGECFVGVDVKMSTKVYLVNGTAAASSSDSSSTSSTPTNTNSGTNTNTSSNSNDNSNSNSNSNDTGTTPTATGSALPSSAISTVQATAYAVVFTALAVVSAFAAIY